MQNNIRNFYSEIVKKLDVQLKKKKKLSGWLYLLRLGSFLLFAGLLILYVISTGELLSLLAAILFFAVFMVLVSADLTNNYRIRFLKFKSGISHSELRFLDHSFSERKTGEEYISINPHFADDFDIFGMGSIFQYLNRCSTRMGEQKFAIDLCKPEQDANIIRAKQSAIKELSTKADFMQDFQAFGMFVNEHGSEVESLQAWLNEKTSKTRLLRTLKTIIPIFNATWIGLTIAGIFTVNSLLIPVVISLWIIYLYRKIIGSAHNKLGNTAKTFEKYAELIKLIENEPFESEYLRSVRLKLENGSTTAGQSLKSLKKLLNSFDIRYNILASLILNSLLLFDIQVYCRLLTWKETHKNLIPDWFSALAEIDSLIGFAVFAINNQENVCTPVLAGPDFLFRAEEMTHPILSPETRVSNTLEFTGSPSVIIITGANMAGKSTFLRTISVNLMLAMNGAPVCARGFTFSPCDIQSSIKIQDSLYKNESYFYAELLRIKEITEHTEKQPRTLVVLDEILRGTNTKDKQTGSLGVLEKLISQKANVIIATHDLVIGELEKKYPDIVKNYCFEVELTNDQLIFDYKLKNGISQKLNASFLMKKMGII